MALTRRSFLAFGAGASTGLVATPVIWKFLDDASIWTQNWPWIPANVKGETTFVPTVSKTCPSATGMRVRLVGGRPVRTVGNPDSPLCGGTGLTALAAAEVQLLHSPARVQAPLRRTSDGAYVQISWDEALAIASEQIKKNNTKIAAVTSDVNGSTAELLTAFVAKLDSAACFPAPCEAHTAAVAAKAVGSNGQIAYDLENSDCILALGANILETWGTVARNRHIYAAKHLNEDGAALQILYAGPVQNNTAAGATWLPIKPGTEDILALGLANILMNRGHVIAELRELINKYPPAKTAELTGLSVAQLQKTVDTLLAAKAPVVIAGSELGQSGGAAGIMTAMVLNVLLGAMDRKGGIFILPDVEPVLADAASRHAFMTRDVVAYLGKEKPSCMIFHEANLAYSTPAATQEAIKEIPFKLSLSCFFDETAAMSDLVLPCNMGLERLDDVLSPYGVGTTSYALCLPVVPAQVDAKPAADIILALAKQLGLTLGVNSMEELIKKRCQSLGANYATLTKGSSFSQTAPVFKDAPLVHPDPLPDADGLDAETVESVSAAVRVVDVLRGGSLLQLPAHILEQAVVPEKAPEGTLALALTARLALGTAQTGIPPYNNKLLRASELAGKFMYVQLNSATATKLGLQEHSKVTVSTAAGTIKALVHISEGVVPDTVAVATGFGHTAFDLFSQNKGDNAMKIVTASVEQGTNLSFWSSTGVNIAKA